MCKASGMHEIEVKNYPFCWKRHDQNPKEGKLATILVEALCERNLYICSWFSCRAGTNNDLNVLSMSPLMRGILRDDYRFYFDDTFKNAAHGPERKKSYSLGNCIYPNWPLFANYIHHQTSEAGKTYTKRQEASMKNIELCFGVMQS